MAPARQRRRTRVTYAVALLRSALVAVALVISLGPAAGFYTKLLAGEPAHVCHCEVRGGHSLCACPICFPELRDEHDHDHEDGGRPAIRGVCGDEAPVLRSFAFVAIPPTVVTGVLAGWHEATPPPAPRELLPRSKDPPALRPPRRSV